MDIIEIAKKIENAGGRLYLVGGAVRDEILGLEPYDKDYCITGLEKEEFETLFPNAQIIGKSFPVYLINKMEFALARKERKIGKGYKGFKIETSKNITIEEDLKRRDITINAMAKDVLTGNLVDPFEGRYDIKNRIIRHISEAFAEDPERAYRVARFSAKFNFNVDNETIKLMNKLKKELIEITPERVFEELKKALTTSHPSNFFIVLKKAEVLDIHFKEIYDLIDATQPLKYHPEGDAFNHSMIVLDKVALETQDETVRFAALVHDLGKGITPKEELPHHYEHDKTGIELVKKLSKRLKLPNMWEKKGIDTVKYHMLVSRYREMRPYKQAILFNNISKSAIGLDDLEIIVNADDMIGREKIEFAKLAKKVNKLMNGNILRNEGILFEKVGKEKFLDELFKRQAILIKKFENEE